MANLGGTPANAEQLVNSDAAKPCTGFWLGYRCKSHLLIHYHQVHHVQVGENIWQFSCLPLRALPMHQMVKRIPCLVQSRFQPVTPDLDKALRDAVGAISPTKHHIIF